MLPIEEHSRRRYTAFESSSIKVTFEGISRQKLESAGTDGKHLLSKVEEMRQQISQK
jgi:hypothetical protein